MPMCWLQFKVDLKTIYPYPLTLEVVGGWYRESDGAYCGLSQHKLKQKHASLYYMNVRKLCWIIVNYK